MTARSTPCEGGCGAYTAWRFCVACQDALASGRAVPGREDRFADVRAQARTVTTPETRRQAPPPVMPQVGRHVRATLPTLDAEHVPVEAPGGRLVGYVTREAIRPAAPTGKVLGTYSAEASFTIPLPLVPVAVDRHAAINKLIGFVTAEGTTDSAVAALLSEAERLKGAA